MITSAANQKLREVQALGRKASLRRERGVFLVEGARMLEETPEDRIEELYVSASFMEKCGGDLKKKLERRRFELLSDRAFAAISDTKTPQGILAVVRREQSSLEELLREERASFLLLETIQDPGNLGTMMRSGEGAGLTAIIADRGTADIYSPKAVRSTMGSIFRVPFVYVDDLHAAIRRLKGAGVQVCAAHLRGSRAYDRVSYRKSNAFLIGNEAAGLCPETAALADFSVRIPMLGAVESLNAAVAAAVLLYELSRQRRDEDGEGG